MVSPVADLQASSLVFYSLPHYAGTSLRVSHGQTGIVASSASSWVEQSVSVPGSDNIFAFLWSGVDTGNPTLSYTGHLEQYVKANIPDLSATFPASQSPIRFLGIDSALAVPLFVQFSGNFTQQNCFASSSLVAGSVTNVCTFASPEHNGVLAFIEPVNGASMLASLTIGNLDNASGTVVWSGSASVMLVFDNDILTFSSASRLPDDWFFSEPLLQADGSWLVVLSYAARPDAGQIGSLTSDKTGIINNGIDTATLSATVTDSASGAPLSGVSVAWNTTLGDLSASTSQTDSSGIAVISLTDNNDIGTATVMARLSNGSSKSLDIAVTTHKKFAIIRGARSCRHGASQIQTGRLVALDPLTFRAVPVVWRYKDDVNYTIASEFIDTQPDKYLEAVNLAGEIITLNVANIAGNGEWTDAGIAAGAFAAMLNNGSYIGWGSQTNGGFTLPATLNHDMQSLSASYYSFAGIRADRSVFAWGEANEGGAMPANIALLRSVVDIKASRGTYILRSLLYPYIQAWGWGTDGTEAFDLSVPSDISAMSSIKTLVANENAFAVIDQAGKIFTWGDADCGGLLPSAMSTLSGISDCCASRRAFAIIVNGTIKAWGDTDYGGNATNVNIVGNASRLIATESAYAAMLDNGGVVCWGNSLYGNSLPAAYKSRTDISDIKSTYGAFAALCHDGTVIAWGNSAYGGDTSAVASLLHNVVSLSANGSSFAALTRTGRVITWGDPATGGMSFFIPQLENVSAIYSNARAFAALKEDSSLFIWGDASSGVVDFPADKIQGNISYYVE